LYAITLETEVIMSQKKEQENLQNVVFRLTPSEIERLDRIAGRFGITRSQFIRNLIVVGLEETELFEKFGMVRAAITVRDICSWMSMKVSKGIDQEIGKEDEEK
jgi:predicted DNA-binding protein